MNAYWLDCKIDENVYWFFSEIHIFTDPKLVMKNGTLSK